jgi:hypothetical protein
MPTAQFDSIKSDAGYFLCGKFCDDAIVGYTSNDISQELTGSTSHIDAGLALVAIHVRKNRAIYPLLACLSRIMVEHGISCEDLIMSGTEIFVIVKDDDLSRALRVFHEGFVLTETCS